MANRARKIHAKSGRENGPTGSPKERTDQAVPELPADHAFGLAAGFLPVDFRFWGFGLGFGCPPFAMMHLLKEKSDCTLR